jgi:cyclopropane fatty-acyl-phospholipid synthase-like methyltransferase
MEQHDPPRIEAMPLYTNLDRIARGLAAQGVGPGDSIRPEQLFALDQWHYHGTDAIAAAARMFDLGPKSRVLDIGAGVGGPARYLAHTIGCRVTALELQPELHAIGVDLTRRTGLADRVTHVRGDALAEPLPDAGFDAVVSWLAIVHIPERARLFRRLARSLRSGGGCYVEDLCMHKPFAPRDWEDARRIVYANSLTSQTDYAQDLESAGFLAVAVTDLTPDWAPFAAERLAAWRQNHAAYASVHGEDAYQAQELFYTVIARLYDTGCLGGVRLVARRP